MSGEYGQAPVPMTIGPLPTVPQSTPPELRVTRHLVGYTEVSLSNGDVIRLHLHVDGLTFDVMSGSFNPSYRIVPEVIKHAWGVNCVPLEGALS